MYEQSFERQETGHAMVNDWTLNCTVITKKLQGVLLLIVDCAKNSLSGNCIKGWISSEKYCYHFHCPKNVLCPILSFVFWIFPYLDTAVQLESADSKQNAISKYLFQDSFRYIFWAMRKMHHTFWKKSNLYLRPRESFS